VDDSFVQAPDVGQACDAPVVGLDTFTETSVDRGVDLEYSPTQTSGACFEIPGGVVAEDMDADGDVDLLFWRREGFPHLYRNHGDGTFDEVVVDIGGVAGPFGRPVESIAALDLNDDRLPEVVVVGADLVLAAPNLGDLGFGEFEVVFQRDDYPRTCTLSVAAGDLDGDGDLDLFLPAMVTAPDADFSAGDIDENQPDLLTPSQDRLVIAEEGGWVDRSDLVPEASATFNLVAAFTDRDADGDLDLLSASHTPFPTLFFRNDGGPDIQLEEDSGAIGFSQQVSSMGIASADLNADGRLDYCISDSRNALVCMLSSLDGPYYEAGAALGLTAQAPGGGGHLWTGWSVESADLDNDGALDVLATAGAPPDRGLVSRSESSGEHRDQLWRGTVDGDFEEMSVDIGFDALEDHYGAAVADLDADGTLDMIIGGFDDSPGIWSMGCTDGAFLQVDLRGPPGNRLGVGARVTAEAGSETFIREVLGPVGRGQSPSRVHLGLGDVELLDRVEVMWPDGETTELVDVGARQLITVSHPRG